jgi:ABC-type glycerol-3-phosphate transport system permease component
VVSSLAAYGFLISNFAGKEGIYIIIVLSFMVPQQVLLIPLFILVKKMHLLNTYLSVIFPYITFGIPIAILILRTFFEQVPKELREASTVDGARNFTIFFRIMMPISRPAVATCVIFLFLQTWNEFLLALVFLRKSVIQTIPVTIAKIGGGSYIIPWGIYAASVVISTIPVIIIFIIFQKWFVSGVTLGAVKG